MRFKIIFLFLLLQGLSTSCACWASSKYAVTIFYGGVFSSSVEVRLPTVKKALFFFDSNGYESFILSNTLGLGKNQWPLNLSNIQTVIEGVSKKIVKDDTVIINIITHGDVKANDHKIILGDNQYLDMSTLGRLIARLEGAGAQVALLDQSCYSGGSLALSSKQTCVVAASSEATVSYREFSEELWSMVKAGKTVENVFLDARKTDKTISYPAISSLAGMATEKVLSLLHVGSERAWYSFADENQSNPNGCIDNQALQSLGGSYQSYPNVKNLRDQVSKYNSTCANNGLEKSRLLFGIFAAERSAYDAIYSSFFADGESTCTRIMF